MYNLEQSIIFMSIFLKKRTKKRKILELIAKNLKETSKQSMDVQNLQGFVKWLAGDYHVKNQNFQNYLLKNNCQKQILINNTVEN